jgi:hypothetical protein
VTTAPAEIDCYVVDTAPLAQAVHRFVAARPHQQTTAWLVSETGVPKWMFDNLLYRDPVTRASTPRRRRIELRHADRIATAIDRPDLMSNALDPVPNPAIARDTWRNCCGGSLTGVITRTPQVGMLDAPSLHEFLASLPGPVSRR